MLTGLAEEIGVVKKSSGDPNRLLVIQAKTVLADSRIGDSIAVNGARLTWDLTAQSFTVEVMERV